LTILAKCKFSKHG